MNLLAKIFACRKKPEKYRVVSDRLEHEARASMLQKLEARTHQKELPPPRRNADKTKPDVD